MGKKERMIWTSFMLPPSLLKRLDGVVEKDSRFETRPDALRFLICEYVAREDDRSIRMEEADLMGGSNSPRKCQRCGRMTMRSRSFVMTINHMDPDARPDLRLRDPFFVCGACVAELWRFMDPVGYSVVPVEQVLAPMGEPNRNASKLRLEGVQA